ncbi:hypothetical protein DFQ26_004738 [Actinomortierella ambigua]|nr:hypothetical protein DFQ26_004738 [Actinomortierella ambigua]
MGRSKDLRRATSQQQLQQQQQQQSSQEELIEQERRLAMAPPGNLYSLSTTASLLGQPIRVSYGIKTHSVGWSGVMVSDLMKLDMVEVTPERASDVAVLSENDDQPQIQGKVTSYSTPMEKETSVEFAAITENKEFFSKECGAQHGIWGLGYRTLSVDRKPTLLDTLSATMKIPNGFALQLCGTRENTTKTGNMFLGGYSTRHLAEPLTYVPLVKKDWYQVQLDGFRVMGNPVHGMANLNLPKSIIDSGTTNILMSHYNLQSLLRSLASSDVVVWSNRIPEEDIFHFWFDNAVLRLPRAAFEVSTKASAVEVVLSGVPIPIYTSSFLRIKSAPPGEAPPGYVDFWWHGFASSTPPEAVEVEAAAGGAVIPGSVGTILGETLFAGKVVYFERGDDDASPGDANFGRIGFGRGQNCFAPADHASIDVLANHGLLAKVSELGPVRVAASGDIHTAGSSTTSSSDEGDRKGDGGAVTIPFNFGYPSVPIRLMGDASHTIVRHSGWMCRLASLPKGSRLMSYYPPGGQYPFGHQQPYPYQQYPPVQQHAAPPPPPSPASQPYSPYGYQPYAPLQQQQQPPYYAHAPPTVSASYHPHMQQQQQLPFVQPQQQHQQQQLQQQQQQPHPYGQPPPYSPTPTSAVVAGLGPAASPVTPSSQLHHGFVTTAQPPPHHHHHQYQQQQQTMSGVHEEPERRTEVLAIATTFSAPPSTTAYSGYQSPYAGLASLTSAGHSPATFVSAPISFLSSSSTSQVASPSNELYKAEMTETQVQSWRQKQQQQQQRPSSFHDGIKVQVPDSTMQPNLPLVHSPQPTHQLPVHSPMLASRPLSLTTMTTTTTATTATVTSTANALSSLYSTSQVSASQQQQQQDARHEIQLQIQQERERQNQLHEELNRRKSSASFGWRPGGTPVMSPVSLNGVSPTAIQSPVTSHLPSPVNATPSSMQQQQQQPSLISGHIGFSTAGISMGAMGNSTSNGGNMVAASGVGVGVDGAIPTPVEYQSSLTESGPIPKAESSLTELDATSSVLPSITTATIASSAVQVAGTMWGSGNSSGSGNSHPHQHSHPVTTPQHFVNAHHGTSPQNESPLTEVDNLPHGIHEQSALTEVDGLPHGLNEQSALTEVDNLPHGLNEQSSLTEVDHLPYSLHEQSALTEVDNLPHALSEQSSLTVVLEEEEEEEEEDDDDDDDDDDGKSSNEEDKQKTNQKKGDAVTTSSAAATSDSATTKPSTTTSPSLMSYFSLSSWTIPSAEFTQEIQPIPTAAAAAAAAIDKGDHADGNSAQEDDASEDGRHLFRAAHGLPSTQDSPAVVVGSPILKPLVSPTKKKAGGPPPLPGPKPALLSHFGGPQQGSAGTPVSPSPTPAPRPPSTTTPTPTPTTTAGPTVLTHVEEDYVEVNDENGDGDMDGDNISEDDAASKQDDGLDLGMLLGDGTMSGAVDAYILELQSSLSRSSSGSGSGQKATGSAAAAAAAAAAAVAVGTSRSRASSPAMGASSSSTTATMSTITTTTTTTTTASATISAAAAAVSSSPNTTPTVTTKRTPSSGSHTASSLRKEVLSASASKSDGGSNSSPPSRSSSKSKGATSSVKRSSSSSSTASNGGGSSAAAASPLPSPAALPRLDTIDSAAAAAAGNGSGGAGGHHEVLQELETAPMDWKFSESERASYERIYGLWERPAEGCVSTDIAGKVFMTLSLKSQDLVRLWSLLNPESSSTLSRIQFIAGLHLVTCKAVGYDWPDDLPDELMISAASVGRIVPPPRQVPGPSAVLPGAIEVMPVTSGGGHKNNMAAFPYASSSSSPQEITTAAHGASLAPLPPPPSSSPLPPLSSAPLSPLLLATGGFDTAATPYPSSLSAMGRPPSYPPTALPPTGYSGFPATTTATATSAAGGEGSLLLPTSSNMYPPPMYPPPSPSSSAAMTTTPASAGGPPSLSSMFSGSYTFPDNMTSATQPIYLAQPVAIPTGPSISSLPSSPPFIASPLPNVSAATATATSASASAGLSFPNHSTLLAAAAASPDGYPGPQKVGPYSASSPPLPSYHHVGHNDYGNMGIVGGGGGGGIGVNLLRSSTSSVGGAQKPLSAAVKTQQDILAAATTTTPSSLVVKRMKPEEANPALFAHVPDAWDHESAPPELDVEGSYIRYKTDYKNDMTVSTSVTANHPINPNCNVFYFEITIDRFNGKSAISIGVASKTLRKNCQVGWDLDSWGYHSDDGHLYFGNGKQNIEYSFEYNEGDTVGCGVNFMDRTVFFTLNGDMLGVAFRFIKDSIPLYPAIALSQSGTEINANFGDQTFLFNIVDYKKASKVAALPKTINPAFTWSNGIYEESMFKIQPDGLTILASGRGAGCIRGPRISPRDKDIFYFEVTMLYMPRAEVGTVIVGICGGQQKMTDVLGWRPDSYGYSGEQGDFLAISENRSSLHARSLSGKMKARARGLPFKTGAVVGCGVDFASRELFFTLNGECLGQAFYELDVLDCFPCVSTVDNGGGNGSGGGGAGSKISPPNATGGGMMHNHQLRPHHQQPILPYPPDGDAPGFEFVANFGQKPFLFDLLSITS